MITDGPPQYFWKVLDQAVIAMGFTSLFSKFKIPGWLIMGLAYCVVFFGNVFSYISGKKFDSLETFKWAVTNDFNFELCETIINTSVTVCYTRLV